MSNVNVSVMESTAFRHYTEVRSKFSTFNVCLLTFELLIYCIIADE